MNPYNKKSPEWIAFEKGSHQAFLKIKREQRNGDPLPHLIIISGCITLMTLMFFLSFQGVI